MRPFLFLLLPVAALATDPTLVKTPLGEVQGLEREATLLWRGIPYAQPPVADLRWRSPRPPISWKGVRPATAFAPDCAQFGPAWVSLAPENSQAPCHNNIAGCVNWTWSNATSEDCLYANVYRSAAPAKAPRPVVVFFAAGAMEWGSGDDLENSGRGLGGKPGWRDVVLVTLNYRKGIFGFLAADELRARDERKTAGAFGLQDQTMALRWVKANIESFGGDPGRVTLFGESAGATSVSLHMVMPDSRGLFHGAIMDSGAFNQWTYRPWSDATDIYKTLVEQLDCGAWASSLDCMLSKSTHTLVNISDTYYGNCSLPHKESIVTTQWAPAMDGVIIPGEPVQLLLEGKAVVVPVLLGSNKNEGSTFITQPPRDRRSFEAYFNVTFGNASGPEIAAFYMPPAGPPPPAGHRPRSDPASMLYHANSQFAAGDFDLRCPTVMAARVLASQGRPTWLYSFDHTPYESVNEGRISSYLGAFHGAEVPFVFYDDFELKGGELQLAEAMAVYWTTFAATGDPNPAAWPEPAPVPTPVIDADADADAAAAAEAFPCQFLRNCEECAKGATITGCVWCPMLKECRAAAARPKLGCSNSSCIAPRVPGKPGPCKHAPTPATCPRHSPKPPPGRTPANCSTPQPLQRWPRFSGGSSTTADFMVFEMCNASARTGAAYALDHSAQPQCPFWEAVCANPAGALRAACAFNRTGPFPSPP